MGTFSVSKYKEELVLVFNIGSSFVEGVFFVTQSSGIPKIVFSTKEPIPIEKDVGIDRLLFLTTQSLNIVVEKVYRAHLGAPSGIFCVLSSPWYFSQIRTINFKKNTPFLFTEKLAENLIQKEINLFKEESLAKNIDIANAFRIIELKNTKTMLNGYETIKPLNKKVKELEMTIFVSICGEKILKKIEDTIGKHFHFNSIKFSSFALASYTLVRDMYIEQEDFLLVDIGGEITDISMIKNGAFRELCSFPLGYNFFTRELASVLDYTLSEASSNLSLFKDGHAEKSLIKKLTPVLNKLKAMWLRKFQEALASLSNEISIPSVIYISIDKDLEAFYSEIIKMEEFTQYHLTESKFKVVFLNTKILHGIVSFKEDVVRDSKPIINSFYINRFFKIKK